MWRSAFLALSTNSSVRKIATRNGLSRGMAARFVAGETLDTAITATREINRKGAQVELDYLGENVIDRWQAERAAQSYLDMLDGVASTGVQAHVSLKPTQMGMDLGGEFCFENIERIAQRAAEAGNFIWVDMEGSAYTQATMELYKRLRARHQNVGIALQAYLYRTKVDVETIISIGGTVRLCKGAYQEPPLVAFPDKRDVDRNYLLLSEMLLTSGQFHALGTHDEKMIGYAIEFARAKGIDKKAVEFQLLYGVRRDLQEQLLRDGYQLRLYVPYGDQWYPYFMRRLAERPANLIFLLGNMAREVRSRN